MNMKHMKKLILFLLLIPTVVFSQTYLNAELVNEEFKTLLNKERKSKGLKPLNVSYEYREMPDEWVSVIIDSYIQEHENMLKAMYSGNSSYKWNDVDLHGSGKNSFYNRCDKFNMVGFGENMSSLNNSFGPYSESEAVNEMFNSLKNSDGHYKNMMDPNNNSFYVVIYEKVVNGTHYYMGCQILKKEVF